MGFLEIVLGVLAGVFISVFFIISVVVVATGVLAPHEGRPKGLA